MLTADQLKAIQDAVSARMTAVVASVLGAGVLSPAQLAQLQKLGIDPPATSTVEDAFKLGITLATMEGTVVQGMSAADMLAAMAAGPALTLSEQHAASVASQQAAQQIVGLGNAVSAATGQLVIEVDADLRNKLREVVQDATAAAVAQRDSFQQLRSDLGWAMGDFTRNLDRIAMTELQNAHVQGHRNALTERYGPDVMVAKIPSPTACPDCQKHYLKGGKPRVFKLSELEGNGTNFKVKRMDWRPVLGTMHPHCQCQLVRVPPGWGFNDDGDLVPGGGEAKLEKAYPLQGRLTFQGLQVSVEAKKGAYRHWKDQSGREGRTKMLYPYGYIRKTEGVDGDHVDVFVGPNKDATHAFVVHQVVPTTGKYDEDKVMLGFDSAATAKKAYLAHYDDPAFFGGMTTLPMADFKRKALATKDAPAMLKSEGPLLLLDLEKAGIAAEIAAASSPWGDRAVSRGCAISLFDGSPPRPSAPVVDASQLLPEDLARPQALVLDLSLWDGGEKLQRVFPIELPGDLVGDRHADEHTASLEDEHASVHGDRQPNVVQLLHKSGYHLYIKREWSNGHWEYTYPDNSVKHVPHGQLAAHAQQHGAHGLTKLVEHYSGKVVPHESDKDAVVAKVPVASAPVLEEVRIQHGLAGKVFLGQKYAILPVTNAELSKLQALQGAAPKQQKKQPVKKEPAPGAHGGPVFKGAATRQGVELANRTGMSVVGKPGTLQRGTQVQAGGGMHGVLAGIDLDGNPVLTVATPATGGVARVVSSWKDVKPVGGPSKEYKPSHRKLHDAAFVQATPRQKELVQKALSTKVVPDATGQQFLDWLHGAGEEAYIVGGIVRDLVAGTHPDAKLSDVQVLSGMKDVDVVSTASPRKAKAMFKQVAPKSHAGSKFRDSSHWGVVRVAPHQGYEGFDFSSMAARDDGTGLPSTLAKSQGDLKATFDHDLQHDTARRDFTANALYYDTQNHVILDPTGNGVADAQSKVLRLAGGDAEVQHNEELWARFWKFRMRGWVGEEQTLERMKAQAQIVLKKGPDVFGTMLRKAVVKKGGDPEKNLAKLRAVMVEDGVGHLFDKYIAPHKAAILKG